MFRIYRPGRLFYQITVVLLLASCVPGIAQEQTIRPQDISKPIGGGRYDCTVFLTGAEKVLSKIDYVEYLLHPTSANPRRNVTQMGDRKRAFALTTNGWGAFWIYITVHYKDGTSEKLRHYLQLGKTDEKTADPKLLFKKADFVNLAALAIKLRDDKGQVSRYLRGRLSSKTQALLRKYKKSTPLPKSLEIALIDDLNKVLRGPCLPLLLKRSKLSEETKRLIGKNTQSEVIIRLNRLFLEEAYLREIVQSLKVKISSKYVRGRYDWTVYLDGTDDILSSISSVEYLLHPTFPNPNPKVSEIGDRNRAFALSTNGWGAFWIYVTVYFKDGDTKNLKHYLQLSRQNQAESKGYGTF